MADDYVEESAVERHVHFVVHQIAQQPGVRVIGLGNGLGPTVLLAVAGQPVLGLEVHVFGERGHHNTVGALVRAVRLLDRLEPGGEHADADRVPVQVGHFAAGDRAQRVRVHRPAPVERVPERVVRVRDRPGHEHRLDDPPSAPRGPEQRFRRGATGRRHQPHVVRHRVPHFGPSAVHRGQHGVRPVRDHQRHLTVHARRLIAVRPQQYRRADRFVHEPQQSVVVRRQQVHDRHERLHVSDGRPAHVQHGGQPIGAVAVVRVARQQAAVDGDRGDHGGRDKTDG